MQACHFVVSSGLFRIKNKMAGRVVAVGVRKPVVAVQIERRHVRAIVEAAASERERTDMHPCIP